MHRRKLALLVSLSAVLAAFALLPSCGSRAQAGPMEVTYYYLPG